jgi:hypothetical protein
MNASLGCVADGWSLSAALQLAIESRYEAMSTHDQPGVDDRQRSDSFLTSVEQLVLECEAINRAAHSVHPETAAACRTACDAAYRCVFNHGLRLLHEMGWKLHSSLLYEILSRLPQLSEELASFGKGPAQMLHTELVARHIPAASYDWLLGKFSPGQYSRLSDGTVLVPICLSVTLV